MRKEEYQEEVQRPKKKRKSHRLYAAVVLFLGIVIITLGILLLFYIQRVEVKGNEYCTKQEIADAVKNDKLSVNSLYVVGKYALEKGEVLPSLESMKVSLKAPWVIKVTVKEKQIVGYVKKDTENIYFDKEGLVVYKSAASRKGIPCVEGIDVKNVELYQQLESDNAQIFEEILEASKELKKYELSTEKIVCKNDRIYIYVGKICISLGNNVTSEKIAQIKPILENLDGKEGTLHLENYSTGKSTITFEVGKFPKEN